jgi:hypothetical protein
VWIATTPRQQERDSLKYSWLGLAAERVDIAPTLPSITVRITSEVIKMSYIIDKVVSGKNIQIVNYYEDDVINPNLHLFIDIEEGRRWHWPVLSVHASQDDEMLKVIVDEQVKAAEQSIREGRVKSL